MFINCYIQTPKVFFVKWKDRDGGEGEYGRTYLETMFHKHTQRCVLLRIERIFMAPKYESTFKGCYNIFFQEQHDRRF